MGAALSRSFTALHGRLPLGMLDRLRAVVFRDWTSGDWYRILTWQRTYDRWSFYVIGFWNPGELPHPFGRAAIRALRRPGLSDHDRLTIIEVRWTWTTAR